MSEPGTRSDAGLLARVADGHEDALAALYQGHAAAMLRLIRRLTSDRAEAEEILQESWLAVWQSAAAFRGDASARAWLLGVARRQAHNRLRRASVSTVELDETVDVAQSGPDVENRVISAMEFDDVVAAIRELPDHLRDVVDLVVVEQLPYGDIARVLGIPAGTVKSRMAHAKKRLASAAQQVGRGEHDTALPEGRRR
ncbi:sigma-70 family RNA polymerase sigma factor [Prauserella halophila]|uniref:Sigma-70 family RNA polymerase sigma factor n=1 Tax=Prauserella halophila TaxID=185641 RepID=A0ABN1W1U4_9PSEU|nr:sigma-70 family RNA polymerase sigma factor [Prauserella halophila]MCP2236455.1 RNA polymerase sigma-70 factor, ECF subfamily [Prauserella halophila]